MSAFSRDEPTLRLRFTGPFFLTPLWRLNVWWDSRWIGHDCDKQPITCRLPCPMPLLHHIDRWCVDLAALAVAEGEPE